MQMLLEIGMGAEECVSNIKIQVLAEGISRYGLVNYWPVFHGRMLTTMSDIVLLLLFLSGEFLILNF